MSASAVYFLRPVGAEGPVKIGSSRFAHKRLATYASWSYVPLEIAALTPGGIELERRFHAAFSAHHSHHEWFRAAPEITAMIDAIRDGSFDPAALPEPGSVRPRKVVSAESVRAGLYTRRLDALRAAGVAIPADIRDSKNHYLNTPEEVAEWRAKVRAFVDGRQPELRAVA